MKKNKVISLVLLLFITLGLMLPASVAAQDHDPQDTVIKQVLGATFGDLGYFPRGHGCFGALEYTIELPEGQYGSWVYKAENIGGDSVYLTVFAYDTEETAVWYHDGLCSYYQSDMFHGYPACHSTSSSSCVHEWQSGRFRFHLQVENQEMLMRSAEAFYANVVKYGLLTGMPAANPTDMIDLTASAHIETFWYGDEIIIQGNVSDPNGGLANACVEISTESETGSGWIVAVQTDSSGKYSNSVSFPEGIFQGIIYHYTVTAYYPGYSSASTTVTVGQEQATETATEMSLTVSTDRKAYSPGETVIIQGGVENATGGLAGAAVVVDVSGTKLSTTTDSSGKYRCEFPLLDISQGTYTVTVTASHSGYPDKSKSTSFSVGQALIVEIDTDKENYLIGETVHCTITVNDSNSTPVRSAELNIIATRLGSGKTTELSGFTDVFGQNPWSFTWGKKDTGEAIVEGKLKIEVTASKEGYTDGYKSITLSGCGDLECCESEDCFICEEDCKCGANEICDPLSSYRNQETLCSPRVAYIFISNDPDLGAAQRLKMLPRINSIRKYYQSLGYKTSTVYVDDIYDVAVYLSRLSTKAIAYFGHATQPSIEHSPPLTIQNAIGSEFRKNYGAKYPDLKEEIKNKATERAAHPDLDYAYMFTCHSLDDTSLRDYLLHSGGTYWGDKGKLYGLWGLQKSVKP